MAKSSCQSAHVALQLGESVGHTRHLIRPSETVRELEYVTSRPACLAVVRWPSPVAFSSLAMLMQGRRWAFRGQVSERPSQTDCSLGAGSFGLDYASGQAAERAGGRATKQTTQ